MNDTSEYVYAEQLIEDTVRALDTPSILDPVRVSIGSSATLPILAINGRGIATLGSAGQKRAELH
jgi:hypothetical protein